MTEKTDSKTLRPDYLMEEIIRYWWERRTWIITTMAGLILLFVIILLLMPEKYRAQATTIVMPPRFLPEARTAPLSVNAARSLLQTGEITQKTVDRLKAAHAALTAHFTGEAPTDQQILGLLNLSGPEIARSLNVEVELGDYFSRLSSSEVRGLLSFETEALSELTADALSESLDSEETVEKRTAADIIYSPLLQLTAVSDSGEKAQVMVNTWAEVFATQYETIARLRTMRQFESLQNQQLVSQGELVDLQTTMVAFQARNNLDLYQREIDEYSDSFRLFSQQLTQKQLTLQRQKGRLDQLVRLIRSMEQDGSWIGKLPLQADGTVKSTGTLSTRSDDDVASTGTLNRIRLETVESRRQLALSIQEFNEFHKDNPVGLVEQEVAQLQRDYLTASSRLRESIIKSDVLRGTLNQLNERISQTSQVLEISTSVPDETVADVISAAREGNLQELSDVQFRREVINPAWQLAIEQRERTEHELATAVNDVNELKKDLPIKEQELRNLQNRYYNIKLAEDILSDQLSRWQDNNDQLFNNYVDMQSDLIDAAQEVSLLEKEVESLVEATSDTRARVDASQQRFDEASAELELLELRQAAVQRNADLLMQKMQEAQIAVREDVSDVSLATRAIAPDRHFFPQRSIFLMVMTAVSGITLLLWLARKRYVEIRDSQPVIS